MKTRTNLILFHKDSSGLQCVACTGFALNRPCPFGSGSDISQCRFRTRLTIKTAADENLCPTLKSDARARWPATN
jgi:hypothetical protein